VTPAAGLLSRLRALNVKISLEAGNLHVSAPKGVITPALQQELKSLKAQIIGLLDQCGDNAARPPTRMPRDGDVPLSLVQQRLWFLDQLDPQTTTYTIAARRRLHGPIDEPALTRALTELVRRHESLRTTFVTRHGEPCQHVAPAGTVTPKTIDLAHVSASEREAAVETHVQAEVHRPFDLARGPLFRPVLLRLAPEEHELIISMHHIVADGWSLGLITRELEVLYKAYITSSASPLPEVPLQYADFAIWQRQWLADDVLKPLSTYWRRQLAALPPTLELPTDLPRPRRSSSAGASLDFELPASLAHSLRELSRSASATVFMTLLAGFKALLARYTGEEDVVIGIPVANRNHVELESLVGFFANTLVLRTDLSGDPTFRQLLERVRETSLEAYSHQDMPFEKLVEELRPDRRLGRNPLFQVSFASQIAGTDRGFNFVTVASPFDLTLFVRDGGAGPVSATIEYRRDLFRPETIAQIARHYRTLLEGAAADPDRRLSRLPLLTEPEARRMLVEWNATATERADRGIPELFEDQAEATPSAVAVVYRGSSVTYGELSRRINQLAHYLRGQGVGPDILVGIHLERSVEMLVAVLAVLKAGGAYVPLDPAYPAERIEFMIRDASIPLVISRHARLDRIPVRDNVRILCLDREASAVEAEPATPPPPVTAELAYVIYTSGSTGRPKGVLIQHRSLANVVAAFRTALAVDPHDVLVAVTTLSFDIAALELFLPLVTGARLVIAEREVAADPVALRALIAASGATIVQATPTMWRMLVDAGPWRGEGIRILCGGEALSPELAKRLLATGASVWNAYGPTETTIWSTLHVVEEAERAVPIGRPIANTETYVLGRGGEPVPVGVPGELHIGGVGVAKGYLNRPELTAERFVPDPFSGRAGARLYRTGDLARYRPDGTLEFMGRGDGQVKVRGFRVELGEIESLLASNPAVAEAVVVVREDHLGERSLAAYVRPAGPSSPLASDLRAFLKERLPDHMVPSTVTMIEAFPLTPNGKVDRARLPAPEERRASGTSVRPRDEIEQDLVRVWEEILAVDGIGTRDNFFDLGGHSMLAVRLFARLEECLHVRLPLATLFEAPTVEALASLIRDRKGSAPRRSLVPIRVAGSRTPVFAVPGVGGNVLCYYDLARLLSPDQPFYGLQSRGLDGTEKPFTHVEEIAAAFLSEIRQVQPHGPYTFVGTCMGGVVVYEMAQQLREIGEQVGLLVLLETWQPRSTPGRILRPTGTGRAIRALIASRLRLYLYEVRSRRGRERIKYLVERIKMFAQVAARRDLFRGDRRELDQQIVTSANLRAFDRYKARVYDGRGVLFLAEARALPFEDDPRLAWRRLFLGGAEIYTVPGHDSGSMLDEPHVRGLAELLGRCLEPASSRPMGAVETSGKTAP
jgi:amino acid adenylation domain-containing protein